MGKESQTAKQQSRLAPLTRQDRFQIALALHSPVEQDVQVANYQEPTENELLQLANALLPTIQARTIFLEGEILNKPGFEEAIREQYAVSYRGMVAAHQLAERLSEDDDTRRFQDDFLEQLRGDYYEEQLAAKKGMLGMLLSITENLVSCAPADDGTQFEALEEAIDTYQYRYPKLSAAMQQHLQNWLRANPGN